MLAFETQFHRHIAHRHDRSKKRSSHPFDIAVAKPEEAPTIDLANAERIARQGNFHRIVNELKEQNLLEPISHEMLAENWDVLEHATFLEPKDIEALTVLHLYDRSTFRHALRVFALAHEHLEQPLTIDGQTIDLKKLITEEGMVTPDQFYRACLRHDDGKVEINTFIVQSDIKDREWAELLLEHDRAHRDNLLSRALTHAGVTLPESTARMPENTHAQWEEKKNHLLHLLLSNHVRCVEIVPVAAACESSILGRRAFTEQQMQELEARGFSRNQSLMDIMRTHEKKSKEILLSQHFYKEAMLVGMHHNYPHSALEHYSATISAFTLSEVTADILRLADAHEAIYANRSYSDGHSKSPLEHLSDLAHTVSHMDISGKIAAAWLAHEFESLRTSGNASDEEIAHAITAIISELKGRERQELQEAA